jgi:2-keto-3-deoxy-L-rhamnonate aldolase RhmA
VNADPLATARELKEALRRGELRVGAFLKVPSPDLVELLARAGMQFVVADAEHGAIGPETCQQMARAAEAAGVPMIVRVGETHAAATVNRYLDTGVAGAQLPRISSVEEARRQLAALLHPPFGGRGLAGGRWARYGSGEPLPDLVRALPGALVVVVQIEDMEALANLDRLLELDEPDVFFIGPTDLAASMGLYGDKSSPHVADAVARRSNGSSRWDARPASSPRARQKPRATCSGARGTSRSTARRSRRPAHERHYAQPKPRSSREPALHSPASPL